MVAFLVWDQAVAGSSPVTSTIRNAKEADFLKVSLLCFEWHKVLFWYKRLFMKSLCYTFLLDERLVSLYFFGVIPVSRLKKLVKAGELGKFRRSEIS